jgi:serine O-acetyltransferase
MLECDYMRKILDSYQKLGGINHIDGPNLPSKAAIFRIAQDLLQLIYPGFFEDRTYRMADMAFETEQLVCSLSIRLKREIRRSLLYHMPEEINEKDPDLYTEHTVNEFLNKIADVRDILKTDAEAAFQGDPAALSMDEVIVAYPFMEAITIQRLAHVLYRYHIPLIPRIMTEWIHGKTGMDLHPGASIGTHFFIDHGTGTVLGETCTIGNHVKLYHNVGLVAKSLAAGQKLRGRKRHPTIEDHVTIYAGATIVGGDTLIGARSVIGGNVFLMQSVPPDSVVLYNEGRMDIQPRRSGTSAASA